jgi:acyl-coenzyme A synthetase/AMP-(fatty) acid ligase
MNMAPAESLSLRDLMIASRASGSAWLRGPEESVAFDDIIDGTIFAGHRSDLNGKSVLVAVKAPLKAALALIELDGVASRLVVCPRDFTPDRLASVIEQAGVDVIVGDEEAQDSKPNLQRYICAPLERAGGGEGGPRQRTEWVLPTSGTTGPPKLVAHCLEGLLGAVKKAPAPERPIVWGTFYDIRRYGGLQIFLRAVTGGSTLVLSDALEPPQDYMLRCREAGVTHISGTPSHWRRLLMSPRVDAPSIRYVRLSGEIADRAILESLRVAFPDATVAHAYASTEAGVGFEVTDGLEGFPASYIDAGGEVALRVEDGSLRIRSARTATRYVGRDDLTLFDDNGFVDTDDMVELRGDRYFFKGRRTGVINIGGLKVHPEEVESVINLHSDVRMSLVRARRSPIMGNVIVAYVVLKHGAAQSNSRDRHAALSKEIIAACQDRLERHKIPAVIDFVASLDLIGSGKLARSHA